MREDQELARAAVRRLPPAALAGLRDTFAAEVTERLPRLRAAAGTDDPQLLATALRDAHALSSSAVVLGEPAAATCARATELLLLEWQAAGGAGPPAGLPELVDELHAHLAGWLR